MQTHRNTFRFGAWQIEPELNRIRLGRESKQLEPTAMALLAYLLERPSETVSARELREHVWLNEDVPESAVDDRIERLRRTFGEGYIEADTDGYRVRAPVETLSPLEHADASLVASLDAETPPFPAYAGAEPYVFVCYSHANRALIYKELLRLRDAGINVWYDEGIAPGSEWTEELAGAIRGCSQFLYYISPESVASRNCRDEVQFALTHRKPLISVHLEPTELPGGLQLAIGSTQAILKHRLGPADYERKLLTALKPKAARTDAGPDGTPETRQTKVIRRTRYRRIAAIAALATALTSAALYFAFALPPTPQIKKYTPLTTSRVLFSPFPSPHSLWTDGVRIYFNEWRDGDFVPREISVKGGESIPIDTPPGLPKFVAGTTPDRSELLIGYDDGPWWLWSPVGASPRRLGTLEGHDLSWSANGERLVNLKYNHIIVAHADGSDPRTIYKEGAHPTWVRLSPDGTRIRWTNWPKQFFQIWEISADGANPHQILPGWNDDSHTCCGSWTPDGRHYVFQAERNGQSHLWVIGETKTPFGVRSTEPRQLTTGAMHFIRPTLSPDGKQLYALGWYLRGEVMRYDAESARFVTHFDSRSAEWLAYSRDGTRLAYVTYPEANLWTSDADGTNAMQLTSSPMRAFNPSWAPSGDELAFTASLPDAEIQSIYVVDADGSSQPRRLTKSSEWESSPTWSSDGRQLVFWTPRGIRLIDTSGENELPFKDGEKLNSPAWSPDGRHVAAFAEEPKRIVLFDPPTERWRELADTPQAVRLWWSPHSDGIFYITEDPDSVVHRIEVGSGRAERVLSLRDQRWVWGVDGIWAGTAADGSLLYLHDQSVHHIYALDWDA